MVKKSVIPINQKEIISITTKYMVNNNLITLEGSEGDNNSCWSEISRLLFNSEDKDIALRIKMHWQRNE
jgi:hypothetical protein